MKKRVNFSYLAALLISLAAALIIGALILLLSGYDPLKAYAAMLSGAFSNGRHIGDTLEDAMVIAKPVQPANQKARMSISLFLNPPRPPTPAVRSPRRSASG